MRTLNLRSVVALLGLVAAPLVHALARKPTGSRRAAVYGRRLPDALQLPKPKVARKRNPGKLARRLMKASVW